MNDEKKKREQEAREEQDFDNIMAEDGQVRRKRRGSRRPGRSRTSTTSWQRTER